MPTVSVKWQKELFPAVEIDTDQPPLVFKSQLFDLTGVPPERQKIMVKGGLLTDDADWGKIGVKDGQRLMMMGTADVLPEPPKEKPVFLEDLPEEMQGSLQAGYTAGLKNLGNTCYMNSTLQCLHSVPELKVALQSYSTANSADSDVSSHTLTLATRDVFEELDRSSYPVAPLRFLNVLRNKFPQFSQQDRQTGMYMQQDAEECWTQLVYNLSKGLRTSVDEQGNAVFTVNHLFGVDLQNIVKCAESGEQSSDAETVYSLKCHISVGVNHLVEGLKGGLVSEIEKNSPALGRSALYVKESLISRLPSYLTVQFVRFFWKRESGKAKILRKVEYPLVLDILEFCTDELKEKLKAPRKRLQEMEDVKAGVAKDSKGKEGLLDLTGMPSSSGDPGPLETGEPHQTGIYDLVSVLTHKGRSADSGHYVAWVKQESGKWIEFDDDNPIPQREEDITKLSGGGDWHMAYICLYKARMIPAKSGIKSSGTL